MKKAICLLLVVVMSLGLVACGKKQEETTTEEAFKPSMDTSTKCQIKIAGGYDNFEALETEFDHFNELYPDVELVYTKVDDYNNMIGTVLNGNDAPDIYFNFSWMYGREPYKESIDHAENLADPALNLNLDCIRSNIKKGYANPIMGYAQDETTSIYTVIGYPYFCETVAEDPEAVEKLNSLDASAGEYMRPALERLTKLMSDGCVNHNDCVKIEDNYEAVILRFFEGDVPMMTCSGDTVSGTKKRESRSEEFIANPFKYTFVPVPISDKGTSFLDMSNLQFSVNKDSANLDMANEFMRFLISSKELSEMAQNKGLMSPTKDLSFNSTYAAFGNVPESRIFSPEVIGLSDDAVNQYRRAAFYVCSGQMTVEDAIAKYGSLE